MECQATRERPRPPRPPQPNQTQEVTTDFSGLQKLHDKGFKYIDKAITLDDQERVSEAASNYKAGLELISKALNVDAESLQCSEDQKNSAKLLQQKMTKTKIQIEYRLQALERSQSDVSSTNGHPMDTDSYLPSYEEAMSTSSTVTDDAFLSLGDSVMNDNESLDGSLVANASEIFSIPEGVQIFYITPEGFVSAPSYPSSLNIFKFTDEAPTEASNVQRPPAFLQVGSWYYPLVPGTSPALRATNGAYIFPDTTSQQQGSAVGLLIPNTATPAQRQQFEQMLSAFTNLQEQQPSPSAPPVEDMHQPREATTGRVAEKDGTRHIPESEVASTRISEKGEETEVKDTREKEGPDTSTSAKIARGITVASEWISWGLGKGSEKAGQYIKKGSSMIKEKLKPEEEAKQIDPKLQKGIQYARKGTHVAVKVSSFVVTKLGEATMAIARAAAPQIRKQGEKLLPESVKQKATSGDQKSKIDGVIEVAASGVRGFGTVYMSLETAAKTLAKNLANETVTIVDHKYGNQAAGLSENAIYAVGNVAMTAYNVDNLGVKAIAKRAAKDTGKALVQDVHKEWKKGKEQ